jgi:hypothetical protein
LNSVWVAGRRLVERGHHAAEAASREAFARTALAMLSA